MQEAVLGPHDQGRGAVPVDDDRRATVAPEQQRAAVRIDHRRGRSPDRRLGAADVVDQDDAGADVGFLREPVELAVGGEELAVRADQQLQETVAVPVVREQLRPADGRELREEVGTADVERVAGLGGYAAERPDRLRAGFRIARVQRQV